ncbi:ABC transporter ATP-binding protein [Acuticoccus kandeliae]|uniref:ABC transporter ATP-binding protein n=1 Tax=Acuticoccus kandeliae TaxID=2073160 RepID=UPI000D3EAED1|nr:ATP-binding cassette domain-containing protein [Acuticoccus kandeliae]
MSPIIETRHLSKKFGGIVVANDIDFTLHGGKVMGLVGPNGAGKSSLVNLICGTVPADSGEVLLHGRAITGLTAYQRARSGIARTWQNIRLFPSLTVLDNIVVAAREYSGERIGSIFRERRGGDSALVDAAMHQLSRVNLQDYAHHLPTELSIGRQKLASLARALMNEGECLFLDEPVAGVEGRVYETLKELIRQEAAKGNAVCIVEHNISFIEDLCDHCVFMFNGTLVSEGTVADLKRDTQLTELYFGRHE